MAESTAERIDRIISENPIGLSEAARLFGSFRSGRPTNPATLHRWCRLGVKLADGRRVFLEFIQLGNRMMTNKAACLRFVEAHQGPAAGTVHDSSPIRRTVNERKMAANAADDLLDRVAI